MKEEKNCGNKSELQIFSNWFLKDVFAITFKKSCTGTAFVKVVVIASVVSFKAVFRLRIRMDYNLFSCRSGSEGILPHGSAFGMRIRI